MENWSVHLLFSKARATHGDVGARELVRYAQNLRSKGLPVIFSIYHLAKIIGVDSDLLVKTIERKREAANYRIFPVHKRSGGRRYIHAVIGDLLKVHRFINSEILQKIPPHQSSFAFHKMSKGIKGCGEIHCGARWVFNFDLKDFFFSISESKIFEIFKGLGYKELLAFEMARLCTTTSLPEHLKRHLKFHSSSHKLYNTSHPLGVLPQGAATSPVLANLVAKELDQRLFTFALNNGLIYSRYADDITFSTVEFDRNQSIGSLQRDVYAIINECHFCVNDDKTYVAGPGSRKVILGLLVDGTEPKLSKMMKKRFDRLIYSTHKYGITEAAKHFEFDSAYGFFNHIQGLCAFVKSVDQVLWKKYEPKFLEIKSTLQMI